MRCKLKALAALSGLVFAFVSSNVTAGDKTVIVGDAKVIDGGAIKFDGLPVRLWGIDAPGLGQKCGKTDAGLLAEKALHDIADGHRAVCELRDYDAKDKRAVAVCAVDGQDIAASMVERGWAWDFPKTSNGAYSAEQKQAKSEMKGVHILSCDKPSQWRQRQKSEAKKRRDKE
jgi:endonuclease YncB( thermonuclease family)